jgi:uncharacterized membrane protein YkoI
MMFRAPSTEGLGRQVCQPFVSFVRLIPNLPERATSRVANPGALRNQVVPFPHIVLPSRKQRGLVPTATDLAAAVPEAAVSTIALVGLSRRAVLLRLAAVVAVPFVALPAASSAHAEDGGDDSGSDNSGGDDDDGGDDNGTDGGNDGGGNSGSNGDESDGSGSDEAENARRAVAVGKARPLSDLMRILNKEHPGKVLDVDLKRGFFSYYFNVTVLTDSGKVEKLKFNAKTLQLVN